MNGIVNTFLLVGDKVMLEMHLKQPGFTYNACGLFTENKLSNKFMQTGNTDFIYKNELDKACFQHDMAYGKSKKLAKRTNYDGSQRGLASIVYKLKKSNTIFTRLFFDKKPSGSGITNKPNYQPSDEIHKQIIRKFKKKKSLFMI